VLQQAELDEVRLEALLLRWRNAQGRCCCFMVPARQWCGGCLRGWEGRRVPSR